MDSQCSLHQLNPTSIPKSIITRNAKDNSHSISKEISRTYQIEILYCSLETGSNPADLATNPGIESISGVVNSQLWRNGSQTGCLKEPPIENLFLRVKDGEIKWLKETKKCTSRMAQDEHTKDENEKFMTFSISIQPIAFLHLITFLMLQSLQD